MKYKIKEAYSNKVIKNLHGNFIQIKNYINQEWIIVYFLKKELFYLIIILFMKKMSNYDNYIFKQFFRHF